MSRVTPAQTNFNGGELSPFMLGRFDHEIWGVSVCEMVGWVPRAQGPLEACPGTEYIGDAAGPCILITLEPYVDQAYVIEASNLLFRFYTNDVLLKIGVAPVTVTHPFSYAQLLDLDYETSNDVMYLFHGDVPPQLLIRDAADAFHVEPYEILNGPFEDRNRDEGLTVAASGTTGSVTLTASDAIFAAGDVGGLFEIEFVDMAGIKVWEPGMQIVIGSLCQWGNNVYRAISAIGGTPRTGTFAPIHDRGQEYDGMGGTDINSKGPYGVLWAYEHNGFGQLKITGFTSATVVTAFVQNALASTDPSHRWRFGAFSNRRGWPEGGRIKDERMVLRKGDTRYLSQVGLLDDFSRVNELGDIGDDSAIVTPLNNPNRIAWMHTSTDLFTGSAAQESSLRQSSQSKGIAPGNVRNIVHSSRGSATVRPVDYDGRPVFVQRNGRKILMLGETQYGGFEPEDLTRYADHIGASRITCLARQNEPISLLWGVRADGMLFGAIMMPNESVLGFFRRPLGGRMLARSITTATSPDAGRDDLWIVAQKGNVWRVMKLAPFREAGLSDANAVMADAALSYDGAPVSTFNVSHLVGETVEVVADGVWLGRMLVPVTGQITLPQPASRGMVGVPYDAFVRLLPIEAGGDNGAAQTKMGRISRIALRIQQSLGLRVTVDGQASRDIENQFGNSTLDAALPFDTKDVVMDMVGAPNRINEMRIDRIAPKQSTILAVIPTIEKAQR